MTKSVKVIWTCTKKITRSTSEDDCMVFISVKRRERPRRTLEEVVKRDLMINDIFEDLVFN